MEGRENVGRRRVRGGDEVRLTDYLTDKILKGGEMKSYRVAQMTCTCWGNNRAVDVRLGTK